MIGMKWTNNGQEMDKNRIFRPSLSPFFLLSPIENDFARLAGQHDVEAFLEIVDRESMGDDWFQI